MTTADGLGRPRPPEVTQRDKRVLAAVRRFGKKDGCRITKILEYAQPITRPQLVYSLDRLRDDGKVERKNGYLWWPVEETKA